MQKNPARFLRTGMKEYLKLLLDIDVELIERNFYIRFLKRRNDVLVQIEVHRPIVFVFNPTATNKAERARVLGGKPHVVILVMENERVFF